MESSLQPHQYKRPREAVGSVSRVEEEMVASIHQALTTKQRLTMLFQLKQHVTVVAPLNTHQRSNDPPSIDPMKVHYLMEARVMHGLALQLGYVLQRHGSTREEVQQLCWTLDLFLQHTSNDILQRETILELGPDFVELLARALAYCRLATVSALSILHVASSSPSGTFLMCQCRNVLLRLVDVLSAKEVSDAAILEVLGCLKNLTYYGDDQRRELLQVPGLVSALTTLSSSCRIEKALERLSAIWRNLAVSPDTRMSLAQQPDILTALSELATGTHSNKSNKSILRNVLNTLVSLALDSDSGILIIFHQDGVLLTIMKRWLSEPDDVIRQRAARTLRLLTSESSAPILVNDTQLMECLSETALHDTSHKVRVEAAEAFARCASLISAPMPQHEAILEALVHLASSAHISMDVLARALKDQASHANNRGPMVARDQLLEALARIAVSTDASLSAKDDVCCALRDLALPESNRPLLATPLILDALVQNLVGGLELRGTRREHAVNTMSYLASVPANRKKMVNHGNLLQSLIRCAATADGSETKDQVKQVILMLVSEI